MRLSEIQEQYEQIMRSPEGVARDRALSHLMDQMQETYHIPTLHNPMWERNNKAIIAMYRKISNSRTTV